MTAIITVVAVVAVLLVLVVLLLLSRYRVPGAEEAFIVTGTRRARRRLNAFFGLLFIGVGIMLAVM